MLLKRGALTRSMHFNVGLVYPVNKRRFGKAFARAKWGLAVLSLPQKTNCFGNHGPLGRERKLVSFREFRYISGSDLHISRRIGPATRRGRFSNTTYHMFPSQCVNLRSVSVMRRVAIPANGVPQPLEMPATSVNLNPIVLTSSHLQYSINQTAPDAPRRRPDCNT